MEIVFATQNQNKVREIQDLMPEGIIVKSLLDMGVQEEIPENADTLEGNAREKAMYVAQHYGVNCFADDTGLEIESLNGEPGVYSARYAGPEKNADQNMNKVLSKLTDQTNRKAKFRTVISLILEGEEHQFEGEVMGEITTEKSGDEGFGYDPIFLPKGYDKTFAQMDLATKNQISHRAKAVQKLIQFFEENH